MPSSTINMFEDNILVEIDGVTSVWDTYCLSLNIVTPGSKRVIFRFKDIEKIIQQGSYNVIHVIYSEASDNQPSSTVVTEDKIKTESDSPQTTIKFEEEDVKLELEGRSAPAEEDGTKSTYTTFVQITN
ncbi:uncharacterized protein F5891DRAFT_985230 [Suillus fuscotomentosus]|uniref:Uncharacterized protein n=1 Tax=Suillus fuscotomentosus TaxID=1912939 RepID=A0AAD4DUK6_9AGAM|nr:uncharacterized protein F5891DRAFT_985230 [Suillus fuscotomentosus]KAG1894230.1 hypothetical protein F5891DRAFT_985230 [Suillus fuscotomentosus]